MMATGMIDGTAVALARDVDAILRVAAPHEHPPFAAPLLVTFAELRLDGSSLTARGCSAEHLDRYAAWLRDDATLVGRPVFAVDLEHYARRHEQAVATKPMIANELRALAAHELAHAILARLRRPAAPFDAETYPAWLAASLCAVTAGGAASAGHGPDWWRLYMAILARVDLVAPRLVCRDSIADDAERYGYGGRDMAGAWIAAAKTLPGLRDAPLLDLVPVPCPQFDALLAVTQPATKPGELPRAESNA